MANKNTEDITITLRKTTVGKMRTEKRGLAWNDYVLRLMKAEHVGARARCAFCGDMIETENIYKSAKILADESGWKEIEIKGRQKGVGFICTHCVLEREER